MPNIELTVDELLRGGPRELGTSDWLAIDQSRIDVFADATDDHQWIHVDPDKAAQGPFGATIAHGYLTLSLVPRLLDNLMTITDQQRGTNYGVERARFTSPVPVGSELRMHGRLTSVKKRDDGGVQFNLAFEVEIRDQERPALVGEVILLTYARR